MTLIISPDVSPSLSNPNMVKNMSLALVSGGSFAVLDGNGNVGEDIFEVTDDMADECAPSGTP